MTTAALEFALPCSPEAAFAAWTEGDRVLQWWGEDGVYRTTGWSADLRPAGAWRADFEGHGETFHAEGEYLEVERPGRLVFTWRPSWDPVSEMTLALRFTAESGGTRLLVEQTGLASDADVADSVEAWRQIVGWLIADLAKR